MSFPTMLKAAVIAIALGGTALTAIPAQAAGPSFSIQFGVNDYNNFDGGKFKKDHSKFRWDVKAIQWKLSQSYKSVQYKGMSRGDYFFIGRKGNVWYSLRVDSRTGHVWTQPLKPKKGGGFSFSFNF
jgi:hypothetical protein